MYLLYNNYIFFDDFYIVVSEFYFGYLYVDGSVDGFIMVSIVLILVRIVWEIVVDFKYRFILMVKDDKGIDFFYGVIWKDVEKVIIVIVVWWEGIRYVDIFFFVNEDG